MEIYVIDNLQEQLKMLKLLYLPSLGQLKLQTPLFKDTQNLFAWFAHQTMLLLSLLS